MASGVVGHLGPRMRQVIGVGGALVAPQEGAILGVDMGHHIVINGDYVV